MLQSLWVAVSVLLCLACFDVTCSADNTMYVAPETVRVAGALRPEVVVLQTNITDEELHAAETFLLGKRW